MARRGFTLIELLVVIAIIALLVSIILPSLARAKMLARQTVCLTNLRQLVLANSGYADENAEFYVLAAEDIYGPNRKRWHGQRQKITEAFEPARGPLAAYLGRDAQVRHCPAFDGDVSASAGPAAAFEAGCGGYGYNASYIGGRADQFGMGPGSASHSARLSDVARPAETVMFTDTAYLKSGRLIAYSFCEPVFWQIAPGAVSDMSPNPSIHFRHGERAGAAWADGHADAQSLAFSSDYSTHGGASAAMAANAGLGWFGPRSNDLFDLN